MTYPSLYQAKSLAVRSGVIEALVPQVFGETAITIRDFLGAVPDSPSMGWVFFQAGNPEFPVWSSGLSTGTVGGGGGGEGSDEVWISPEPPPGEGYEIWYDSDATPPASNNVVGPASAVDSTIPLFSGTTGKLIKGSAAHVPAVASTATTETTSATAWTDLVTVGPSVTMTTGSLVRITFGAQMRRLSGANTVELAMAVSGATTIPANTAVMLNIPGGSASAGFSIATTSLVGKHLVLTGWVTPGVNTFTVKYQCGSGTTGEYSNRFIMVERLD